MKQNYKSIISALASFVLLTGFVPSEADAAGAKRFDFENLGCTQVNEYFLWNDDWELSCTKTFEYYPDGTLKTVFSNSDDGFMNYEGHYDPHGNLMDPSFASYAGYVEGVLLDLEAQPVRDYDSKGRLTHFEAQAANFGGTDPVIVEIDYEYDSNNRVSKVAYRYRYDEDEEFYDPWYEVGASTGCIFSYARDGSYTITYERRAGSQLVSRTSFCYDTNHRLIRYDSVDETISDDGEWDSECEVRLYSYDEDGYLIREAIYMEDNEFKSQSPVEETEYQYRWIDDHTLACDMYWKEDYSDEKPELQNTVIYRYDENGKLTEIGQPAKTRYSYDDGAAEGTAPSVEDVRAFGSEIAYPKRSSYLDEYETMVVRSSKGHSIYVYWKPVQDEQYLRKNYFIPEGTEVTVLAREDSFSCVIFQTKNGKEHIGWVASSMLAYE